METRIPPSLDRLAGRVRDWLAAPPSPSSPSVEARRNVTAILIKLAVLAGVTLKSKWAVKAAVSHRPRQEQEELQEEIREPAFEFDENELTENRIHAFRIIFGNLTRREIVLVDQHGNIIGGIAIPVPDEVDQAPEERREAVFQEWLNRIRTELKELYPTIEFTTDSSRSNGERPELYSERLFLRDLPEGRTKIQSVLENAGEKVSDGETNRFTFARKIFAEETSLPQGLRELLIALPGVESAYDPTLVHPGTKATGAWQIMEELGREIGMVGERREMRRVRQPAWRGRGRRRKRYFRSVKKLVDVPFDYRKNFEASTRAIAKYFQDLYQKFRADAEVQEIMKQYGLREEDFIYPLVLQAYHSGAYRAVFGYRSQGRWKDSMVQWFLKTYTPAAVKQKIGNPPYGQDIYTFMGMEYMRNSGDNAFFRASRDYYAKVAAMRDLLDNPVRQDTTDEYVPPEAEIVEMVPRKVKQEETPQSSVALREVMLAAGVGTALCAVTDEMRRGLTRRGFFTVLAANSGAAVAGTVLGLRAAQRVAEHERIISTAEPPESRKDQFEYDEEFFGKINQPFYLNTELLTAEERQALRRLLNPDLRQWIEANGVRNGLSETPDLEALQAKHSQLKQLKERSWFYRLRGVGNIEGGIRSDMDYAWTHPAIERTLEELGRDVNAEAHAAGLPERYQVRLIVTGAARTESYQRNLRENDVTNAAAWTSHAYLNSFDLAYVRFDILDTQTGAFGMIHRNNEMNRQTRYAEKLEAILGRKLIAKMNEGKIMALREGVGAPCYHVMVTKLDEKD